MSNNAQMRFFVKGKGKTIFLSIGENLTRCQVCFRSSAKNGSKMRKNLTKIYKMCPNNVKKWAKI